LSYGPAPNIVVDRYFRDSIILTVIGVQIMILLRDAHETMKKADHNRQL
jgi:hypothetical protein